MAKYDDPVIEGFLPVGQTHKNLDTTVVEQTDGTDAHREAVLITDPEDNDARLKVFKPHNSDEYHIRTQDVKLEQLECVLEQILKQQQLTNTYLSEIVGDNLGEYDDH